MYDHGPTATCTSASTETLAVIPATMDHIAPVAARMRQADRNELAASSGRSPTAALELSLFRSADAHTVLLDNIPAGMFGCCVLNVLCRKGSPWFLGTDAIDQNRLAFARASVFWRDQLLSRYDCLTNVIDARNASSIRWLKWLGFTISEPVPVGRGGLPFRIFELRR